MAKVNTKTGFSALYEAVREQEEKNECPLYLNECFLNTSGKQIDAECIYGGAMFIFDDDDLREFWRMVKQAKRRKR